MHPRQALILLCALGAALLLPGAGHAAAATTRYAASDGLPMASDCTDAAAPCSLDTALRAALPGDTISLAGGSYPLDNVTLPAEPLNWRPTDPNTRPVLTSLGVKPTIDVGSGQSGSTFQHIEIDRGPNPKAAALYALKVEPGMTATFRSIVVKAPQCIDARGSGPVTVENSALTGSSTAVCLAMDAQFTLRRTTVDRRIEGSSEVPFSLVFDAGLIEDSRIAGPVFMNGPTAVVRRSSVDGWFGVDGVGLVVDSVVKAHGPGQAAATADAVSGSSPLRVINSTVVSSGGPALLSDSVQNPDGGPVGPNELVVTNSIARGATVDVQGTSTVQCPDGDVCDLGLLEIDHSDFATRSPAAGAPGGGIIIVGAGNRAGDPLFADPVAGDYHLRAGSAAIDAGTVAPEALPADHDGLPRFQGTAPDLGAYEFPQATPPGSNGGPGAGGSGPAVQRAALLSALRLAPSRFHASGRRAGTTIRFALDRPSSVTLVFERVLGGRHKLIRAAGLLSLGGGHAGTNRIRFSGRVGGRRLARGSYLVAATPAGGRTRSARFEVA